MEDRVDALRRLGEGGEIAHVAADYVDVLDQCWRHLGGIAHEQQGSGTTADERLSQAPAPKKPGSAVTRTSY